MKALSACIAIGVTIIGCGSSSSGAGGGSDPGATCGMVPACGGDIVGTWQVGASCASITSAPMIMGCASASVKDATVTASGSSTFNSDMTYTVDVTEAVSETLVIPMSCLSAGGTTVTCSEIGAVLGAALMGDAGAAGAMTDCTTSGSDCDCKISGSGQASQKSGTYSISGNTLTTVSGGVTSSTDYCVQGNQLHVITTATASNEGVSEDVVGVKQ